MAEITPEERVQKVKAHLLEDLEFEPEQVRNFYTTNIFGRALAHLVGWTGTKARMLRCTAAGELKVAPTSTGIEHHDTGSGSGPDAWGGTKYFDQIASRVDIFVWDNPLLIRRTPIVGTWEDEIEVPVGFYSIDAVTAGYQIQNKTEGQVARYQVVGWW